MYPWSPWRRRAGSKVRLDVIGIEIVDRAAKVPTAVCAGAMVVVRDRNAVDDVKRGVVAGDRVRAADRDVRGAARIAAPGDLDSRHLALKLVDHVGRPSLAERVVGHLLYRGAHLALFTLDAEGRDDDARELRRGRSQREVLSHGSAGQRDGTSPRLEADPARGE